MKETLEILIERTMQELHVDRLCAIREIERLLSQMNDDERKRFWEERDGEVEL